MPSDWVFVSVDVELTNQCSCNCLMCPRDAIIRPKGFMAEDRFKVIHEILVREESLITFSGMGDPLSHLKVFEWIYEIRQKGGCVGIVVNPASLNSTITQKLIKARPNSITLSFPSVQKKVFELLCPKVSFDDAMERTMKLIGLTRGNVALRIAGIITEINQDEQGKYVHFWKGMGVHSSMTPCHGRGGNLNAPSIYKPKSAGLESKKCGLFQFYSFITWEGDVLACCHDLTGDTRIGNLVDEDISAITERKREILKNSMPFSACQSCDEPLRLCSPPITGSPPKGKKERNKFFRKIKR